MATTGAMTEAGAGCGTLANEGRGHATSWVTGVLTLAFLTLAGVVLYGLSSAAQAGGSRSETELSSYYQRLCLGLVLVTAGAGSGLIWVLGAANRRSRRAAEERLKAVEEDTRRELTQMESQLEDSRKTVRVLELSQKELRSQVGELTGRTQVLQAELDCRKRNERSLSQERLALESSKTVLELHVQASSEELQKLQRRYELILNAAGEGICGLDLNGKTAFVNPAVSRITGWSREELIGKTEKEIFYPNDSSDHSGLKDGASGEEIFWRKDGSSFPVEFVRTSIEENGRRSGSVLIFKDITQRKHAEETLERKAAELARSNAELEQFAFIASHDLQEPLRKIQAFGDRLKTKIEGHLPPEATDYLERIQGAASRMRKLIDDLLAFSRVIRSSEPLVGVDLGQTVREALGDLEVRIEKTGAKIEFENLPTVEADPTQMRQLLLNLLGNALKFQPPGNRPQIQISSRLFNTPAGEPWCELTVKDNGVGFEEQYAEKIFAVFQRLHGRGEYEGTGVGLAICRRITDRHQGTITATSQPGQGATFVVRLPRKQPQIAKSV